VKVKYAFICSEEGNYPIEKMCRWAKVSRSGYYAWHGRCPSPSQVRRRALAVLVSWCFEDSDGTYGYRRVHAALARLGQPADPETIRALMRELGLVACQPRPWRPTTTVAGDAATHQIWSAATSLATSRPPSSSATSPTSLPGRAGCTWRRCWTATPSRSWATRWRTTSVPR